MTIEWRLNRIERNLSPKYRVISDGEYNRELCAFFDEIMKEIYSHSYILFGDDSTIKNCRLIAKQHLTQAVEFSCKPQERRHRIKHELGEKEKYKDIEYAVVVCSDSDHEIGNHLYSIPSIKRVYSFHDYLHMKGLMAPSYPNSEATKESLVNWIKKIYFYFYRILPYEIIKQLDGTTYPNYYETFYYGKQYDLEKELKLKRYYGTMLLISYIKCRDFFHIKELCCDEEFGLNQTAKRKISNEIEYIEKYFSNGMSNIKGEQYVVQWLDNIGYNQIDIPEMEYIRNKQNQKDAVFFQKAYAVMPWTHWTLFSMFTGKLPIDDELYKKEYIDSNDELIKLLEINKLCFYAIGAFSKKIKCIKGKNKYDTPQNCYTPCSFLYYRALLRILNKSKRSNYIMIHSVEETHQPNLHGDYSCQYNVNTNTPNEQQSKAGIRYQMQQLRYYDEHFFSKLPCFTEVYLCDHGFGGMDVSMLDEVRTHIFLIVEGTNIEGKIIDRLFSIKNYSKLILKLLKKDNDYNDICEDYIPIQGVDIYDSRHVTASLELNLSKDRWMQQRGIISSKYRYILLADGSEMLFDVSGNKLNIDYDISKEEIDKLREKAGDYFIDIRNEERFTESIRLYHTNGITLPCYKKNRERKGAD